LTRRVRLDGANRRVRLGQHFLVDPYVVDEIVQLAQPRAGERFVEIGPGRGALTGPLLDAGAIVDAVEIDAALVRQLRQRWPAKELTVHLEDALEFDYACVAPADLRLIGNLPYYLSTPLLFRLLERPGVFRDITVMLQREVAERLCAQPGSRRYGRLTVMAALRCRAEWRISVGPDAFRPRPKVDSAVVRLIPDSDARIEAPKSFERLVRQAFSQRRKTIANALRPMASKEHIQAAGIDPSLRPEQIAVADYARLAERLRRSLGQGARTVSG